MSRRHNPQRNQSMPTIKEDEIPRIPSPKSRPAPVAAPKVWSAGPPRPVVSSKAAPHSRQDRPAHLGAEPRTPKVVIQKPKPCAEGPSKPILDQTALDAAFAPWPESEEHERPRCESPKALAQSDVQNIGDKIVRLIATEVEMCREMSVKTPQTFIRLYPSPPYDYGLNAYVVEKAQSITSTGINWHFGRDVITIVF